MNSTSPPSASHFYALVISLAKITRSSVQSCASRRATEGPATNGGMSQGSNYSVCKGNLNFKIQQSRKITSQLSPIYLNYTVNVHLNLQTFCPPPIFRVIRSQVPAPRTLRGVSMAPGVRQTVSRTNSPVTSKVSATSI